MSRIKKQALFFLMLSFVFLPQTFAEDDTRQLQDAKAQEDEKTKELERISAPVPVKEKLAVKYGFWASSTFRQYTDFDNNKDLEDTLKESMEEDLRFWIWATYLQKHSIYLRFRNLYIDRDAGSGYTGIGSDNEGPYVDMAYLVDSMNLGNIKIGTKIGRQFFTIGRGIAFSGTHDGLEIDFTPPDFYLKTLIAHSNPKDDNIDLSVPEYDKKENRIYLGTELSYTRFYPNIFYVYGLIQRDRQEKYPAGTSQNYRYDSQYLGFGVDKQSRKGWSYWSEVIKEWGADYNDTTYVNPRKSEIDAWAVDLGTRYMLSLPLLPTFEAEYAFGSGDTDRTDVTDTKPGGNQTGDDKNFSYYGYFGTGYALAGRLSNLEQLKLQFGITPLMNKKFAKSIDVGAKLYFYRKAEAEGPIYDTQATQHDKDVGKELNLFLYWEPSDNLYLNIKYGIFYPGEAFSSNANSNTKYFLARATLKF
ncbi:MAG: alginate export family protein [Candidatus Omnitrophica bacterium]|nr:alginate export family protein [Candidatus Omnitrophota bacterium]HOX54929.1 alginate export family protein [Candidatus Omnitrophota bacterium]